MDSGGGVSYLEHFLLQQLRRWHTKGTFGRHTPGAQLVASDAINVKRHQIPVRRRGGVV